MILYFFYIRFIDKTAKKRLKHKKKYIEYESAPDPHFCPLEGVTIRMRVFIQGPLESIPDPHALDN